MPVKLVNNILAVSLMQRIDDFRKTIKDDEGYTAEELGDNDQIGAQPCHIRSVLVRNQWWIKQWSAEKRRALYLLVNPKILAKYAAKSKKSI
jgi:hypothetical protein